MDFINIAFYLVTLLANYFFPHGANPQQPILLRQDEPFWSLLPG